MSNRYGEKVGDATKQGFNVIGNIGKIVTVYKEEANEYIHERNGTVPEKNREGYQPIGEIPEQNYETKMKSE